jgi:hypothetical protein
VAFRYRVPRCHITFRHIPFHHILFQNKSYQMHFFMRSNRFNISRLGKFLYEVCHKSDPKQEVTRPATSPTSILFLMFWAEIMGIEPKKVLPASRSGIMHALVFRREENGLHEAESCGPEWMF